MKYVAYGKTYYSPLYQRSHIGKILYLHVQEVVKKGAPQKIVNNFCCETIYTWKVFLSYLPDTKYCF